MNIVLKTTAVLMLVLSLNLQWTLLQTVAWTGMIVSYSRITSFTNALVMTFDGKHPCTLCKVVEAGRGEANSQDLQPTRLVNGCDQGLIWEATGFDFTCQVEPIAAPNVFTDTRLDSPPKPRPRGLLPDHPTRV